MAPAYMPSSMEKASTGGIPKESGMSRATPIAAVRPGMAPNRMPKETPVTLAISEPKLKAASIPVKTSDIVSSYGNMI